MLQRRWFAVLWRWRYPLSAVYDATLWVAVLYLAAVARLSFDPSAVDRSGFIVVALVAVTTQLVVGYAIGLYRGRQSIASFGEILLLIIATLAAGTAATVTVIVSGAPSLLPISAVLAATAYEALGAFGLRYLSRLGVEMARRSSHQRAHATIIFGAGSAGSQVIRALQRDPSTNLEPVAILDDDPTKRRLRVHGVPVVGTRNALTTVAQEFGADTVLIAVPSISQRDLNEVADAALGAGLFVKILPSLRQIEDGTVRTDDIREMEMGDFLNREEVDIDLAAVGGYLRGRRVLVTGAGGSIGSQLCRSIRDFDPDRLVMLDHDENALHALELGMNGRALLTSEDLVLCDIRDASAVQKVFDEVRPHVVFHAAAHKHVTFLERFPSEGYKTNVEGTANLIAASLANGVERFVNISTDKAAEPTSVLGETKRQAEIITARADQATDGRYTSVRFGNVLGSTGSVLPIFLSQLEAGKPLTVTHPDATRYFMTVKEAVQLVLQAGALGVGGDVLVLDMGDPVKIIDLATRLARRHHPTRTPDVEFTGLRSGEKLHEVLVDSEDIPLERPHPRIQRFQIAATTLEHSPAAYR